MSVQITRQFSSILKEISTPANLLRPLRRADDFIRLGVLAANETIGGAMEDSALPVEEYGLILGSAFGTMETNVEVLERVVTGEPTSPILFSHSVFNAAAGYIASIFDIRGCALTISDFSFPFFRALEHGSLAIESGRLKSCLVLQVETYSGLLHDAQKKYPSEAVHWQPGVSCWLLEKTDGNDSGNFIIESIHIESSTGKKDCYLDFEQRLQINGNVNICTDPLRGAALLTTLMTSEKNVNHFKIEVDASFGHVELSLAR